MNNTRKCFVKAPSMTAAMKLKRILAGNDISSEVMKKTGASGCTWGVEYDCIYSEAVKKIVGML